MKRPSALFAAATAVALFFGGAAAADQATCAAGAKIRQAQSFFSAVAEDRGGFTRREVARLLDHGLALSRGLFLGDRAPIEATRLLAATEVAWAAAQREGGVGALRSVATVSAQRYDQLAGFYSTAACAENLTDTAATLERRTPNPPEDLAEDESKSAPPSLDGLIGRLPLVYAVDPMSRLLYAATLAAAIGGLLYVKLRRRRRHTRYRCYFPTEVIIDGRQVQGHVLDFSRSGVKIRTERAVDVADKINVVIGPKKRAALIRWRRGQTIGVEFAETLSRTGLSNLKRFASEGAGFYQDEVD